MTCIPPPFPFNYPSVWYFRAAVEHAARDLDNLTCTSYWRSPRENLRVGGDPFSQHQIGWAIDVAGADRQPFARACQKIGLTTVMGSDYVHVQLFPKGALKYLWGIRG